MGTLISQRNFVISKPLYKNHVNFVFGHFSPANYSSFFSTLVQYFVLPLIHSFFSFSFFLSFSLPPLSLFFVTIFSFFSFSYFLKTNITHVYSHKHNRTRLLHPMLGEVYGVRDIVHPLHSAMLKKCFQLCSCTLTMWSLVRSLILIAPYGYLSKMIKGPIHLYLSLPHNN